MFFFFFFITLGTLLPVVRKLKVVEHNALWFGTGMGKVEQLSADAVSKHYSFIFTLQGRSEGKNPRESNFRAVGTWSATPKHYFDRMVTALNG